jgi:hypothetical protein
MVPSVPEISSRIHLLPCFGKMACCPTPALSLCAFPDVCWVPAAPLGSWLVASPPLSTFAALCACHWEFGFLPHPHSLGHAQHSTPTSVVIVRLKFTVYVYQFFWGKGAFSLPRGCAALFSPGMAVGRGVTRGAWCSPVFCHFMQAALELAGRQKWWRGIGRLSMG